MGFHLKLVVHTHTLWSGVVWYVHAMLSLFGVVCVLWAVVLLECHPLLNNSWCSHSSGYDITQAWTRPL